MVSIAPVVQAQAASYRDCPDGVTSEKRYLGRIEAAAAGTYRGLRA